RVLDVEVTDDELPTWLDDLVELAQDGLRDGRGEVIEEAHGVDDVVAPERLRELPRAEHAADRLADEPRVHRAPRPLLDRVDRERGLPERLRVLVEQRALEGVAVIRLREDVVDLGRGPARDGEELELGPGLLAPLTPRLAERLDDHL